jgi:low affinity Fe/Cu permease
MVFLIQNSQNRDAAAMQAKLDELIRAVREARGQFIGIEHRTDKEIQEIRTLLEEECAEEEEENPYKPKSNTYLERLLKRR